MDLPPAPTPPVNNSGMASNAERTTNLLNLLKFNGSSSSSSSQQQPQRNPQQQQQQQQQAAQHQPSFSKSPYSPPSTRIHQPAPAGADPTGLLAALMRGSANDVEDPRHAQPAQQAQQVDASPFGKGSPSVDTTSFLLNLLNRPKPSQTDQPALTETSRSNDAASRSPDTAAASNSFFQQYQRQQPQSSPLQQQQQQKQQTPSDPYVEVQSPTRGGQSLAHAQPQKQQSPADMSAAFFQQLMGSLNQASPQPHTSQPTTGQASAAPLQLPTKEQALTPGSQRLDQPQLRADDGANSHHLIHRAHSHQSTVQSDKRPSPTEADGFASVQKKHETVAEAVHDLAGQADKDAQDALNRAEKDLAAAAAAAAGTDADADAVDAGREHSSPDQKRSPEEATAAAVKSIEKQIVQGIKEGKAAKADDESPDARAANDTSDSGNATGEAQAEIADSWESADQEEIVVIEEKEPPPVRVYNLPLKPWISVSLQGETKEARPEFRDESIMDIARLKKEFDQIDRNLYTASQTYMTYGMSKQGGLRVIRQDDGKDAKVFTDTKDRIFNVAMSVHPSDHESVQREVIIGTGVSGTVYWVQIKDGGKDHIEDPHLEQHGFALPPISSHDGDISGGVLKTRARASTSHPEYFAVGRGKFINFIWPAYILQNKLFKSGHDRVVDTEALLEQCSLKINTGKAGKDFIFSQDDSVVVSLDKSGRVKFWDIRDLTAVREDSDSRFPLPSHSSLEIREPIQTLVTTPEGEKAWPTSVLLLDKQRPHQRRCALRYMIIGMKQNHTLQLWDLSLGKPVQELNLPHSKESDAVCSVTYHPASGMIVIGHPTRNSIYFAHLSAPRYNFKSPSQAELMQRIAAQDSSLPQPDSTAVISGVREYSFANRGMLRSLDILCNPAMVQDTDEPTLFELYAMHSKGVACVLVRQSELGWSKENKVLDGVDAVKAGLAVVSKLKNPQPAEAANGDQTKHTVARVSTKESTQQAIPDQIESTPRVPETATPVRLKNEPKETETPVQSSKEGQAEKSERRSRKKKAGAASKEFEPGTNGVSGSARTTQPGKAEPAAKSQNSPVASNAVTAESLEFAIQTMQTRLTAAVSETLKSTLKNLHAKIDEGARQRDEKFNEHQMKLLDMVSEVLNENTQKVLESLIHHQFTELVIPAISDKATKAVSDVLHNKLQPSVASSVQKEIQNALPQALKRTLQSTDFVTLISERVGTSVGGLVQQEVAATLTQRLAPTLRNLAAQSAQQAAGELHQQHQDQLELLKSQHAADGLKMDQVMSYVTRLTDMVSTMAASQSSLQAELIKLKQQQPVHELPVVSGALSHARDVGFGPRSLAPHGYPDDGISAGVNTQPSVASYQSSQPTSFSQHQYQHQHQQYLADAHFRRGGGGGQHLASPHGSAPPPTDLAPSSKISGVAGAFADQASMTDAESEQDIQRRIQVIEQAIKDGRLQDAMIQWIQSGKEKEIFDRCLSMQHPSRFENLPPLVLLVVIATIAKDLRLTPRLKQEIDWIEMAVRSFGTSMPQSDWEQPGFREMIGSVSQTMQLLTNRVARLVSGYESGYPVDPWLANVDRNKMEWIMQSSEHIFQTFGAQPSYS